MTDVEHRSSSNEICVLSHINHPALHHDQERVHRALTADARRALTIYIESIWKQMKRVFLCNHLPGMLGRIDGRIVPYSPPCIRPPSLVSLEDDILYYIITLLIDDTLCISTNGFTHFYLIDHSGHHAREGKCLSALCAVSVKMYELTRDASAVLRPGFRIRWFNDNEPFMCKLQSSWRNPSPVHHQFYNLSCNTVIMEDYESRFSGSRSLSRQDGAWLMPEKSQRKKNRGRRN